MNSDNDINKYFAKMIVNKIKSIKFQIDSGASCNVISLETLRQI